MPTYSEKGSLCASSWGKIYQKRLSRLLRLREDNQEERRANQNSETQSLADEGQFTCSQSCAWIESIGFMGGDLDR